MIGTAKGLAALGLIVAAMLWSIAVGVQAQTSAEAAVRRPGIDIAVLVSSRGDLCYDPGDVAAITRLATFEQQRINAEGGIAGRAVRLVILDDERDQTKTNDNLRKAIADPATMALIGLTNSTRAKAAFDVLGREIESSAIPFLSGISITSIFAPHRNVFTMQASQDDERLPVMAEFLRSTDRAGIAIVGLKDGLVSRTISAGLKQRLGEAAIVADLSLAYRDNILDPAGLETAVAALKDKRPEVLVAGVGNARLPALMTALIAAKLTPALFVTGRIDALPPDLVASYPAALYQLAWDRLPEAHNDRLHRLISKADPGQWNFEGRKMATAPGWASGVCKPRDAASDADTLRPANLRAIEIGAQFADMVGLVAAAARRVEPGVDIARLRRGTTQQIATAFEAGRGAHKGTYDNWSFHANSRAAVRTPFVVIHPYGLGRTQLAPEQFLRAKDGTLTKIDTLYVDIDLVRAHRIEDNEKSFLAEFYLSMRNSPGATIDRLDFTNAVLDPRSNGRQITIENLHGGGKSEAFPEGMRIYKVTGRFVFEPDLANYPFDSQRFSIDIQAKRGAPFIIQTPPSSLRDQQVATDGWTPRSNYVGYDEDFIPMVDAFTHAPSIAPFFKSTFVWQMRGRRRITSCASSYRSASSCASPTCRSSFRNLISRPS